MTTEGRGGLRPMLRYELKRTWRSPTPWLLLLVAAAVWGAALLQGREDAAGWRNSALVQHREVVYLLPVFLTLLSVYLTWETQRDRRAVTEAIFLGWPVPSWRRALAGTLALGSVTMASWLLLTSLDAAYAVHSYVRVATAAGDLGVAPMLRDIGIMAADHLASLLGAQATAQVVAAMVPGIGGLVLVILYRIFALLGPGVVMATMQWPYAMLVKPELAVWWFEVSNLTWQPISEAFGLAPYERFFWTHRAFWIGGSLATLTCLVFLYRNRRDRPAVRSPVWAGTALVAAVLCAVPFVSHGKALRDAFAAVVAEYGESVKPQFDPDQKRMASRQSNPEATARPEDSVPVRYEIEADLTRGPEGRFQVQLEVELTAPASEIPLTLRRVFQVESVAVDGQPVSMDAVVRTGDLLRIPLADERESGGRVRIGLAYTGRIEDWRLNDWPEVSAIARKGMLLVPATWGWYPVPGQLRLAHEVPLTSMVYRAIMDRDDLMTHVASHFDVTLRTPAGIRSVAGFEPVDEPGTAGCRWRLEGVRDHVSLVGGGWWPRKRDGITYLVPREQLDTWETATADLHALLQAMEDWTGPEELTVVPTTRSDPRVPDLDVLDDWHCGLVYGDARYGRSLNKCFTSWFGDRYGKRQVNLMQDNDESDSATAQRLFDSVLQYVEERIEEAGGEPVSSEEWEGFPEALRRWAETTPLSEQKRQIRELFAAARTRPLTEANFAFLGEGEGP